LWENDGSYPGAVWHRRSDGFRDETDCGVRGSVHGKGHFWGEFGIRHCIQWGLYACDSASTVGAAVWGSACGGPRGMGLHVVQGEEQVLAVFVLHFHNGKCQWVADSEMFPIRMRKLHNITVRQTYRWKARFVAFLAMYSISR